MTLQECRSVDSLDDAFVYTASSSYISFINCEANGADGVGFIAVATVPSSRFDNCLAYDNGLYGFSGCWNMSGCSVDGNNNIGSKGFYLCYNISSSNVYNTATSGFEQCYRLNGCSVDGNSNTDYGFRTCSYVAACYATACSISDWSGNSFVDPDSCNAP